MWTWICLILPPGIRILNIICIHIPVFRRRSEWTGLSWTGRRFELISQSRSGRTPPPPACTWADPPGESPGTTAKEGEGVYFFLGGGLSCFLACSFFIFEIALKEEKYRGVYLPKIRYFCPIPFSKMIFLIFSLVQWKFIFPVFRHFPLYFCVFLVNHIFPHPTNISYFWSELREWNGNTNY